MYILKNLENTASQAGIFRRGSGQDGVKSNGPATLGIRLEVCILIALHYRRLSQHTLITVTQFHFTYLVVCSAIASELLFELFLFTES
jgi:hypothetical protein